MPPSARLWWWHDDYRPPCSPMGHHARPSGCVGPPHAALALRSPVAVAPTHTHHGPQPHQAGVRCTPGTRTQPDETSHDPNRTIRTGPCPRQPGGGSDIAAETGGGGGSPQIRSVSVSGPPETVRSIPFHPSGRTHPGGIPLTSAPRRRTVRPWVTYLAVVAVAGVTGGLVGAALVAVLEGRAG